MVYVISGNIRIIYIDINVAVTACDGNGCVAVSLFGLFVGLNQFSRFVIARCSDALFKRLGAGRLLMILCAIIAICFVAILVCLALPFGVWTYALLTVIVVGPATQKMSSLIFSSFIHARIKSTERGTVISVKSMIVTLFNAIAMFAMKPLLDGYGIFPAVLISFVAFGIILWSLYCVLNIVKK